MLPMSHLEAIIGAMLAKNKYLHPDKTRIIYKFKGFDVIDISKNLNVSTDIYDFEKNLFMTSQVIKEQEAYVR